jgi:putative intracellular protease/amidase
MLFLPAEGGLTMKRLKVLVIVKENSSELEFMLTKEVAVITDTLEQSGFEAVVASASGQPMVTAATTLTSDLKLKDVKVVDYAGVIIPCMMAPEDPKVAAIVKEAVAEGNPVAAQFSSIPILAEAGVLSGKKYAFITEERAAEHSTLKDGIYSGYGVVQDGKIITSGVCPLAAKRRGLQDGTTKLTKTLVTEITGEK